MASWCYMLYFILHVGSFVSATRKNVIFIVADDLRPELGAYASSNPEMNPDIITPNLDALARESMLFRRAYVQQAVCSPSRASFLTGRRPDTTHVYNLQDYWRHVGGDFTTIPQYFKENGYISLGGGKIMHSGKASGNDDPISWTEKVYHSETKRAYWNGLNALKERAIDPIDNDTLSLLPLPDTEVADFAISALNRLAPDAKDGKQPFFLGVGFHKPHLPFRFPETFYNLYPEDKVKLPSNPFSPENLPSIAWASYELWSWKDIAKYGVTGDPDDLLPDEVVLRLRRAYFAAVSHMDYEVGRVLAEIKRLGLSDNTVISFIGDHGFELGEHSCWSKHDNFEISTNTPMMIKVPGLTDKGIVSDHLTEFVDLFPTLVEAAGLPTIEICPPESTNVKVCHEGVSLVPLMRNPAQQWKSRVFMQYPRWNGRRMGYSMRTNNFRYTEWVTFSGAPNYKPNWDEILGVELYDHSKDKQENVNVADNPDYLLIRQELSRQLRAGWRGEAYRYQK